MVEMVRWSVTPNAGAWPAPVCHLLDCKLVVWCHKCRTAISFFGHLLIQAPHNNAQKPHEECLPAMCMYNEFAAPEMVDLGMTWFVGEGISADCYGSAL